MPGITAPAQAPPAQALFNSAPHNVDVIQGSDGMVVREFVSIGTF